MPDLDLSQLTNLPAATPADFSIVPQTGGQSPLEDPEAGSTQTPPSAPAEPQEEARAQASWPGLNGGYATSPEQAVTDVPVVDPDGRVGNVPFGQLQTALGEGWKPASPETVADWDSQGPEVAVVDPDGNVGNVNKLDLDTALAEGHRLATPQERREWDLKHPVVYLKDSLGNVEAASRDQAAGLQGTFGYVPATDEDIDREYGDLGSQAATGIRSALQGATAHVFKPVMRQLAGDSFIAEMDQGERLHPATAVIGEVGGTIAGAVATAGASLGAMAETTAARLALTQTPMRAAGTRLAAAILGNAVDGAAYGAVSRTADGMTGDDSLDVENILLGAAKDAGWAALLGGGIHVAAHAVSSTARAAGKVIDGVGEQVAKQVDLIGKRELAKTIEGKTLPQALDDLADVAKFKQLAGSNKAETRKFTKAMGNDPDASKKMGRWLYDNQVPDDPKGAYELLDQTLDRNIATQHSLVDQLDATGVKPNTQPLARDVAAYIDDKLRTPEMRTDAIKLRNELKPIMKELQKPPSALSNSYGSFDRVWELRQWMDKKARFEKANSTGLEDHFKDLRSMVEDFFQGQADDIAKATPVGTLDGQSFSAAWQKAKTETRMAGYALKFAENRLAALQGNNALSLRASMAGLAGGNIAAEAGAQLLGGAVGHVLGPLGGVAGGVATGALAQKVATGGQGMVSKGYRALSKHLKESGVTHAGKLNLPPISRAIGKATDALDSATSVVTKTLSKGIGTMHPNDAHKDGDELHRLPQPEHVQASLKEAADILAGDGPGADALDDILDAVADKRGLSIANTLQSAITARAQYLLDVSKSVPPGKTGQLKLARIVSAMDDPLAAVKRIAVGRGTDEDVDVLQKVYPRMHAELVQRINDALVEHEGPIDPKAAARLSRQLGVGLTRTSDPAFVSWLQSVAHGGPSSNAQDTQASKPGKPSGKQTATSRAMLGPTQTAQATLSK